MLDLNLLSPDENTLSKIVAKAQSRNSRSCEEKAIDHRFMTHCRRISLFAVARRKGKGDES